MRHKQLRKLSALNWKRIEACTHPISGGSVSSAEGVSSDVREEVEKRAFLEWWPLLIEVCIACRKAGGTVRRGEDWGVP